MPADRVVYLCMGSACHQRGVYDLLPRLRELLAAHDCRVELKGSFCLGPCTDGIVLQVGQQVITRITAANVADVFDKDILPHIRNLAP